MSAGPTIADEPGAARGPRAMLWRWVGRPLFRCSPRTAYKFRRRLLNRFGAELAPTVKFRNTCRIDRPWNLAAEALAIFGDETIVRAASPIRVGKRCVISQYTALMTTMVQRDERGAFRMITGPIEINDDCWVATDCTVLPGVVIPEGVVVGARSLVGGGDIEPWTIASGTPAKSLRQREPWSSPPA
ncbi:MAG: hypothetical protein H6814_00460 [Phycisphaeraceae bacterium]|nr:hypothetical protein [Phycisphaeraceae bacterium]